MQKTKLYNIYACNWRQKSSTARVTAIVWGWLALAAAVAQLCWCRGATWPLWRAPAEWGRFGPRQAPSAATTAPRHAWRWQPSRPRPSTRPLCHPWAWSSAWRGTETPCDANIRVKVVKSATFSPKYGKKNNLKKAITLVTVTIGVQLEHTMISSFLIKFQHYANNCLPACKEMQKNLKFMRNFKVLQDFRLT